ncbi:MAG: class I SAM-dependent methyltransferase [Desulfobacterales bacterium]|nr:class I SAM-dependent methyltransferase [Desulfobacterales bacterium]MBF0398844.1 class I SAM-dependent methyltransferase [Desulfobacterales bacterium]
MNHFAFATRNEINEYRESELCRNCCGNKPFGSRHWEYPWAIKNSGLLHRKKLKVLDVAPDFTFPYTSYIESLDHEVVYIDIEKRQWADKLFWGADAGNVSEKYRIMDVRRMSFDDNTFDCIMCISVLEHIVCPTQNPDNPELHTLFNPLGARPALLEMRRCLKPGGSLVFTIDIYGGPKWKPLFSQWDIFADLIKTDFIPVNHSFNFDIEKTFQNQDTFLSDFYGPYITLGFSIVK